MSGSSRFEANSFGVRGREPAADDRIKILTVGGSTTECLFLDQSEAWPQLLEQNLRASGYPVWVGSAAQSGRTLTSCLAELPALFRRVPKPKICIFLSGGNDFLRALVPAKPPRQTLGWTRLIQKIKAGFVNDLDQGVVVVPARFAGRYNDLRLLRARHKPFRTDLPDLSSALAVYQENILLTADLCRRKGIRPVFLTQPVLWQGGENHKHERLLWMNMASNDNRVFYSEAALERGIRMFNEALMEVCDTYSLDCMDLSAVLPKTTAVFYDDMHFNESGAALTAGRIAELLILNDLIGLEQR